MNSANFLNRLNEVVTGDKFLREIEISLSAVRDPASGLSPFGADGGTAATVITPTAVLDGISFDDAETAILQFNIPQDYDEGVDKIALRLHEVPDADSADTTDLGITTAQTIFRKGAAENATASTAKAEAATASTGQLVRENVLDISGRSFKPGDMVQLILDANNSGTTELVLLGIDLIYSGDVAAFNDVDRFRKLGS